MPFLTTLLTNLINPIHISIVTLLSLAMGALEALQEIDAAIPISSNTRTTLAMMRPTSVHILRYQL